MKKFIETLLFGAFLFSTLAATVRAYVMDRGRIVHHSAAAALLDDRLLADRLLGGVA